MQLSLPPHVSPEPAGATAGAASPAAGLPGQPPADSSAISFAKFLPKGGAAAKPAAKDDVTDPEKAAAILAASFCLPAVVLPLPVTPLAVPGKDGNIEAPAPALASVFFASPSSRAFLPLAPDAPAVSPADKPVPTVVPGIELGVGKDKVMASALAGPTPVDQPADVTIRPAAPGQNVLPAASGPSVPADKAPAPEKIAAANLSSPANLVATDLPDKKDFLNAGYTAVTVPAVSVGISVAQRATVMPAVAPNRSKSTSAAEPVPVVSVSTETRPALNLAPEAPAPVATLRETMAAVVSAVAALERRDGIGQKMLDLQFHVGDERLALRVELRDGTVHTTFRTDSAELRSALAQEWQAIVPLAANRDTRLAEPVFSSSAATAGESAFGSLGQGTPHQRGQAAPPSLASVLAPDFPESVAAEPSAAAAPVPGSTQLLHVFA